MPDWVVVGAGTGGTSATIGRYLRYRRLPTRLAVVDPEGSAFFPGWRDGDPAATGRPSRIEGIGRPRVEPSFVPTIVDRMFCVPDAASVAAMRHLEPSWAGGPAARPGRTCGAPSSSWPRWSRPDGGASVVTLLCDGGERYARTYYSDAWLASRAWTSSRTADPGAVHGQW